MSRKIFVNLPVKDLPRSIDFFTQLGFSFNAQFTDKNATCMIVAPDIFVMLLVEPFFTTFTQKPVCDAARHTEVIICLSAESRSQVDELVQKAMAAGGSCPSAKQEQPWMYGHGFEDLDGHLWEIMWMDQHGMAN